jgi:hypothetical protein
MSSEKYGSDIFRRDMFSRCWLLRSAKQEHQVYNQNDDNHELEHECRHRRDGRGIGERRAVRAQRSSTRFREVRWSVDSAPRAGADGPRVMPGNPCFKKVPLLTKG